MLFCLTWTHAINNLHASSRPIRNISACTYKQTWIFFEPWMWIWMLCLKYLIPVFVDNITWRRDTSQLTRNPLSRSLCHHCAATGPSLGHHCAATGRASGNRRSRTRQSGSRKTRMTSDPECRQSSGPRQSVLTNNTWDLELPRKARDVGPKSIWCWASVCGAGPASYRPWTNVWVVAVCQFWIQRPCSAQGWIAGVKRNGNVTLLRMECPGHGAEGGGGGGDETLSIARRGSEGLMFWKSRKWESLLCIITYKHDNTTAVIFDLSEGLPAM